MNLRRLLPKLVRGSMAGSLLSGLLSQATLVVSGVLVARMLGVENRGYLALLILIPYIASQLGGLGLPIATTYFVAQGTDRARAIVGSLARPFLLQALVIVLAHLVALRLLTAGEPEALWLAGLTTLLVGPAAVLQQFGLALLQGQRRFRPFNTLRVMPTLFYGAGILALFVVGEGELLTAAIAWTAALVGSATLTMAVALWSVRAQDRSGPVPSRIEMTRFGLRGLLGSAAPSETFRLDQAVVGLFLSPAALGLYVVAMAFTNLPRFLAQSVGMVAYPHVAVKESLADARRSVWRYLAFTAALTLVVIGALELAAGQLMALFFGEEFLAAVPIARILLIAGFFWSLRRTLTDGARGAGLPLLGSLAEIVSWVVLPIGIAILAPLEGAVGVAAALAVAAAASFAVLVVALAATGSRRASRLGRLGVRFAGADRMSP